jgi:AcrR family transcriptional regulator
LSSASTTSAGRLLQNAALDLFERHGVDHTTIDMISEQAGVSRRTFFRYFTAKEDAAMGDHHDRFERFALLIANALGPSTSRRQVVVDAGRAVLQTVWSEPDRFRQRYRTVFGQAPLLARMRETDSRYEELIADFTHPEFAHDDHAAFRARMFAAASMAAVNSVLQLWIVDPEAHPEELYTNITADLLRATDEWAHPTNRPSHHIVVISNSTLTPEQITHRLTQ